MEMRETAHRCHTILAHPHKRVVSGFVPDVGYPSVTRVQTGARASRTWDSSLLARARRLGYRSAVSTPARALPLTGERTVPGIPEETYWFCRHEVAYLELGPRLFGARVLEAGCGEGYGPAMLLRAGAASVTGIDYDATTIAHVAAAYPDVAVVRADLAALPLAAGSVDAVTHLQVIEHLHDQPRFITEAARVLTPIGELVITTPNRLTFSPGRATPLNPFHTRELSAAELLDLLDEHFLVTELLGVHHGPRLADWEAANGSLVDALIAGPPTDWTDALRQLVLSVTAADFLLAPDAAASPIDASLDLFAIARRR